MLDTGPKERNDLIADAVKEVEASVHQFEWPMPPVVKFTGMKKAKFATHDPTKVIKAELNFIVDFITKTGATLQLDIPVTVNRGEVVPPSTFYFENRQYVLGQKAVNAIVKRNTSFSVEPMRKMYQPVFDRNEQQIAAQAKYEQGYKARENDGMFGGRGIVKDRRLAQEKIYGADEPIYPMSDEHKIATELLEWHGGQGSDLYAVGSSWYAGHKVDALLVWNALWELKDAVRYYASRDDEEDQKTYESGSRLIDALEQQLKHAENNGWDNDDPRYEEANVFNMVSKRKAQFEDKEVVREMMTMYDSYKEKWIEEFGSEIGYDDWFTEKVMQNKQAQFEDMEDDEAFKFLNKQVKQLGKDFQPGFDDLDDRSELLNEMADFMEADDDDPRFARRKAQWEDEDAFNLKVIMQLNNRVEFDGFIYGKDNAIEKFNSYRNRYRGKEKAHSVELLDRNGNVVMTNQDEPTPKGYDYSDGVEEKYEEMINEEYPYNRAREIVEEYDADYANARDMAIEFSDEFGSGESIYWWEDVARMFLEYEFGEITNPKKARQKTSRKHVKPSAYEQVVKLMESAKDLGVDSFPRMYEHIEREYILDVLNTASRDQWEMHLINDGWCINSKERLFRKKKSQVSLPRYSVCPVKKDIDKHTYDFNINDLEESVFDTDDYSEAINKSNVISSENNNNVAVVDNESHTIPHVTSNFRYDNGKFSRKAQVEEFEEMEESPVNRTYPGTKTPLEPGDKVRFHGGGSTYQGKIVEVDDEYLIIHSKGMEYRVPVEDAEPLPSTHKKMYME